MMEPFMPARDVSRASEPSPEFAFAGRPSAPERCHPLTRVHYIVETVLAQPASSEFPSNRAIDPRVIRAAVLQCLYSFGSSEHLIEHLRYNVLYRWFVGLPGNEHPWSAASYDDALQRMLNSIEGAGTLRTALIRAQASAALSPDRFRIDRALFEDWTSIHDSAAEEDPSPAPMVDDPRRARLDWARDIILRRIGDEDLTPDSIATEMCMSRRALFLLFEKHGLTPTRVIRDLRLDHCRRLLLDARHRQRKITDIALDYGFANLGTFSRQFKDRYGVSPVEFRFGERGSVAKHCVQRYSGYAEAAGIS